MKQTRNLCFLLYTKKLLEAWHFTRLDLPSDFAHHLHHLLSPLTVTEPHKTTPQQEKARVRVHITGIEAVRRIAAEKWGKRIEECL